MGSVNMSEYIYDEKGKWKVQGCCKMLIEFSVEEKNKQLAEKMKVTYTLPNISREEELIALQTLEIEDLKEEINNIKKSLGGE